MNNNLDKKLRKAEFNFNLAKANLEDIKHQIRLVHTSNHSKFTKANFECLLNAPLMPRSAYLISLDKLHNLSLKKQKHIRHQIIIKRCLGKISESIDDFFSDNASLFVFGIGLILYFLTMFMVFPFNPLLGIILSIIIVVGMLVIDNYVG